MGQARQYSSRSFTRRSRKDSQSTLLLIGSEEIFKNDVLHHVFWGRQFRVAGRSGTLLDGLSRLESKGMDLVLLSYEFCEEEFSLFTFDARRRGFFGPILHLGSGSYSEAAKVTYWKTEPNATSEEKLASLNNAHAKPFAYAANAGSRFIGTSGSIVLTAKQQAVMTRVSEGQSNQEIANELNCSASSVKAVLQQLFTKFGVRRRAQLVRLAIESVLIEPETIRPFTVLQRPPNIQRGKP